MGNQNIAVGKPSPASKKSNTLLYVGVAALIIAIIGYSLSMGVFNSNSGYYGQNVSKSEMRALYAIANNQTLASIVGTSAYSGLNPSAYIKRPNLTSLNSSGVPVMLYVGAEYCPFCAATRWPIVLTLMRFGNLTGLQYSASSSTDTDPNTPTFSFVGSSYSSNYLRLKAFEVQNRTYGSLMQLPPDLGAIYNKYSNGIPFLDFGNKYIESGSLISPMQFDGKDWGTITAALQNTNTTISQSVIGAANIYTAQICEIINNSAPVCAQPYVRAAASDFLS